MTPDAFRQALATLGYKHREFARAHGYNNRTIRRMLAGQWAVSEPVKDIVRRELAQRLKDTTP